MSDNDTMANLTGTDSITFVSGTLSNPVATVSDEGAFTLSPLVSTLKGMVIGKGFDCAMEVAGQCVVQGNGTHLYTNHGWEQRAADYAVGFGLGSAMATALFIVLVRAFVVPKRQRVVGPTESVGVSR